MTRISLSLDFKSLIAKLKTNIALMFYAVLALIILFEISIFYGAIKQVVVSRQAQPDPVAPKGVRLQLNEYQEAAKRIQAGKKFYPGSPIFENPFGTK